MPNDHTSMNIITNFFIMYGTDTELKQQVGLDLNIILLQATLSHKLKFW